MKEILKNYRIAVASSDGVNIDLHFARASTFYIYEIGDKTYEFLELRNIDAILRHDEYEFDRVLKSLEDCGAVIVSQIGIGALASVASKGLRVFEAPYPIESVLNKLVNEDILNRDDNKNYQISNNIS